MVGAYDEHVNDHQLMFSKAVAQRQNNIVVIEKIIELGEIIDKYTKIIDTMKKDMTNNNEKFCIEFEKIIDGLVT